MGQGAKPRARFGRQLPFLDSEVQFLVALKPVEPYLPPEMSEISPHPWVLSFWKTFSFLGQWAEQEGEVWMAAIGRTITWSEQVGAWTEEEEAWAMISPAHPSPAGPRLSQEGRWMASS